MTRFRRAIVCAAAALVGIGLACGAALRPASADEVVAAVLRGLDKTTARITTFEAPIGREVAFGTLRILTFSCQKRPPEEPPEVAVFLSISEHRIGDDLPTPLFSGWMFASSPALSAMEHPVYDVWVIDCKMASAEGEAPASEKSAE